MADASESATLKTVLEQLQMLLQSHIAGCFIFAVTCDGGTHGFLFARGDLENGNIQVLKIARDNLNARIAMLEGN
jgi:hypothetical protein